MRYYTVPELAKKIGKNRSTLHRHAVRLGIGELFAGRRRLSERDAKTLAAAVATARPGNPNMVPGNKLWRRRKNLKKSGQRAD